MRLVFLGPPGAGKGTQAELLFRRFQVRHLSSGDLLRKAVQSGDPRGRQISQTMRSGVLVPDEVVTELMLHHVEELGKNGSFVLDGFPRTVEQAQALDARLQERGYAPVDVVVDFDIADDAVVERLDGRRVCEQCGANYHVTRMLPRRADTCDRCGGALRVRPDDRKETILKRLSVYQTETAPLLEWYRKQGKLKPVPGDLHVEEQYQALEKLLKSERLLS